MNYYVYNGNRIFVTALLLGYTTTENDTIRQATNLITLHCKKCYQVLVLQKVLRHMEYIFIFFLRVV